MDDRTPLDERELARLRWRCRRGLLENDLFIERFFARHGDTLTVRQARGLAALMDLADNDLLDLLLRRREPEGALATPEVIEVLALLRTPNPHDNPPTATTSKDSP
ncbi:MAG: succinate dehydrogenase assembly factor 2 [Tepidimonas ignava]|uniref:FAD assembly factor SdhE n=1 Tax=Tepidimonas ignava TaxID=114249 RepID=A0A4R3LJB1_9BURK|nr:succinate dehydrogenase assembly factor 2 [Tepidimonas ignava]MCX7692909.1 succinate dehydrogenase assembly factor 2 [Tepidimonas taiwanensis]TCS98604.1 antitoxin CptB [Tepidimonas ignava]TSE20683.1 FAD assembly factor SdhE [Tepidimonas ignava]